MKYVKKLVEVEAVRFVYTNDGIAALREFCGDNVARISKARCVGALAECHIITLEDGNINQVEHMADEVDWIINGVAGEFYPCKQHIFDATYDDAV